MNSQIARYGAAAVLLFSQTAIVHADIVFDDFDSGSFAHAMGPSGFNNPATEFIDIQAGSMLGGHRLVTLETSDTFGQGSISTISAGKFDDSLLVTTGIGIGERTNIVWGISQYGALPTILTPLNLDLSGADRVRMHFDFLSNQLNVNIQLFNGITPYAQLGQNILQSATPFDQDFLFADDLAGHVVDYAHIDLIVIIIQTPFAGTDFAIGKVSAIRAVPLPPSWPLLCAALLGLRRRVRRSTLNS